MLLCIIITEVPTVHLAFWLQGWRPNSESGGVELTSHAWLGITSISLTPWATVQTGISGLAWITVLKEASQEDFLSDWALVHLHTAKEIYPSPKVCQTGRRLYLDWVLVTRAYPFIRNHWIVHLIPVHFTVYTFSLNEKSVKHYPLQLPVWMN